MTRALEIVPLVIRQDLVNRVADAVHDQWGALRARTPEQSLARFSGEVAEHLPLTQVALLDGAFVGAASLRHQDSKDYLPGKTPWICNVVVLAVARGRGVATRLCSQLILQARQLGFQEVFLATTMERDSLYHRMGFREIARSPLDGGLIVLRMPCAPTHL